MHEQLKVYEEKMQKTMKSLDSDLAAIRAGRANPHILDRLTVDYYGIPTPIQQVANVSVPEARMIHSAVGEEYVKGDYQSDPDVGYRNQSDQ